MIYATFPYKQKTLSFLVGALILGVMSYWLFNEAMGNVAGLNLKGIELSPAQARVFGGVFLIPTACLFLFTCAMTVASLFTKLCIEIHGDALYLPRGGFSRKLARIPFSWIQRIDTVQAEKSRTLTIEYKHGRLEIEETLLESPVAFDRLKRQLEKRMAEPAAA